VARRRQDRLPQRREHGDAALEVEPAEAFEAGGRQHGFAEQLQLDLPLVLGRRRRRGMRDREAVDDAEDERVGRGDLDDGAQLGGGLERLAGGLVAGGLQQDPGGARSGNRYDMAEDERLAGRRGRRRLRIAGGGNRLWLGTTRQGLTGG